MSFISLILSKTGLKVAGCILVAIALYFAYKSISGAYEERDKLRIEYAAKDAELKATKEAQTKINKAVDTNSENTRTIVERTHTIEEKINAQPITTQCVESPAIGYVLSDYNERMHKQNNPAKD